jgi:hypothetical protein
MITVDIELADNRLFDKEWCLIDGMIKNEEFEEEIRI